METQDITFASLLKQHTDQAAMKANRLMTLIQQRFPTILEWKNQTEKERCVSAIENWLYRSIEKPHAEQWPLVVAIAAVLSLTRDEVEQLLRVAGMKTLGSLQQGAAKTYQELFGVWMKPVFAEEVQGSLTEIGKDLEEQGGLIKDIHTHVLSVKRKPLEEEKPIWIVPFARNPYFTGREDVLVLLDKQLSLTGNADRMTISRAALTQPKAIKGLGGIGKTQIAVEYAYYSRDLGRYMHTFWVNAVSEETIIISFATIADLLPEFSVQREMDQCKLVEAVKRWLEQCRHRWLLIFDNADDIALVRDYLPQQGIGSILLTTRANAVGSLATSVEVETMGFIEGTQLLLRRAQRFEHASDEEVNLAGNIVVALDHFPLALDQAGAYIEETRCSFTRYLQVYQNHRKDLLARRGQQSTRYPESVATTWSLSFQKVEQANPAAAELLRLCAFLAPDDIPEELISNGASNWTPLLQQTANNLHLLDEAIAELHKYSLVKLSGTAETLSIHRLVQAVLVDTMDMDMQIQWAGRIIQAVNGVFPNFNITNRQRCLRYLSQAQECNRMIDQYQLILVDAMSLLDKIASYLSGQALYSLAEPLYQRNLEMITQLRGKDHRDMATGLNNLATLYLHQGKHEQAWPLLVRALEIRTSTFGDDHPEVAIILCCLARLFQQRGEYETSEKLLKRAFLIRVDKLEKNHPDVADVLQQLADLYLNQGKYEEVEELLQSGLKLTEHILGAEHPDTAASLSNLAVFLDQQHKHEQAEVLYQRALEICERAWGVDHPSTTTKLNNLATCYMEQGKYEQAEPLFLRALKINEHLLGNHPDTAGGLDNLATLYYYQKKYEQAEPLRLRALNMRESIQGRDHPNTAISLNGLAMLYRAQKKYKEAEPLFLRALKVNEHALGENHPDTAISLSNLAGLYRTQGRYAEAEPLYQRALTICEQELGAEHPNTQTVRTNYTALLETMKQKEDVPS